MKRYQPESGEGSDPFWGGLFSRRGDRIACFVAAAIIIAAWLIGGAAWGGGALFVAFMLWVWIS